MAHAPDTSTPQAAQQPVKQIWDESDAETTPPLSVAHLGQRLDTEMAVPLQALQAIIDGYSQSHELPLEQAQKLVNAVQQIEALAERSRRIGELAESDATAKPGIVSLDEAMHAAIDARGAVIDQLDLDVRSTIKPIPAFADEALVRALAVALVDWGLEGGHRIAFLGRPAGVPPRPVLQATVLRNAPVTECDGEPLAMQDTLSWRLIADIARRLNAPLRRTETEKHFRVAVAFNSVDVMDPDTEALPWAHRKPWWSED